MSTFKNNDSFSALYIDNETLFRVGSEGCTSINLVMENGTMAEVPWFEVFVNDELDSKWNGAMILGVKI